ncbi:MAG: sigma-70 family RNA polymerase sigma factor [Aliishimia sp.]
MVQEDSSAQAQAALLTRAASGDAVAAQALAADLGPRVLMQATRMLGNRTEAEDVAQDTLLRLWRVAPKWKADGGASLRSWCYGVARNLCIDRMRRYGGTRSTVPLDDINAPEDPTPGAEARLQTQSRARALQDALQELPERQRQAVVLRHIEGMTNPEIAEQLDISVEAVESLVARGKRALAGLLAGRQAELGFEDDKT